MQKHCRFCGREGLHKILDLGCQPLSNAFLTKEELGKPEVMIPLEVYVCDSCFLVQTPEIKKAKDIFNDDYIYYSSQSPENVKEAKKYVAELFRRFGAKRGTTFLEIASNDGYLLQHVIDYSKEVGRRMVMLGIEPSKGPAAVAQDKKIPTLVGFFGQKMAQDLHKQDFIVGINVLAHVPDINDFVAGVDIALAENGVATFQFPYLINLIDQCQFDTIYHEHFSYFSFSTVCEIFRRHGMEIFDVQQVPMHGGSLRIYAQHDQGGRHIRSSRVSSLLVEEGEKGVLSMSYYENFQSRVDTLAESFKTFMTVMHRAGGKVVGYGAAAKGNTFLNYCGMTKENIEFVADQSPHKQLKYLPGNHIPVLEPSKIKDARPDFIVILAWNMWQEVMEQLDFTAKWDAFFVTAIPELSIFNAATLGGNNVNG